MFFPAGPARRLAADAGARCVASLEAKYVLRRRLRRLRPRVVVGGSSELPLEALRRRASSTAIVNGAGERRGRASPAAGASCRRASCAATRCVILGGAVVLVGYLLWCPDDVRPVEQHLLSVLVFLPALGAIGVAAGAPRGRAAQKLLGLGIARGLPALAAAPGARFQPVAGMQFEERRAWLPAYGISYHVGIDGISLWLVILTTFLTPARAARLLGVHRRPRPRVQRLHAAAGGGDDRACSSPSTCSSSTSSGRRC